MKPEPDAQSDVIDLPDDNWAQLYQARRIPEKRRRVIQRASLSMARANPALTPEVRVEELAQADPNAEPVGAFGGPPPDFFGEQEKKGRVVDPADLTDDGMDALDAYNDALVCGFVRAWSFELPIEPGSLMEFDGETYDALLAECNKRNKRPDRASGGTTGEASRSPDDVDPSGPSGASSAASETETETDPGAQPG